MKMNIQYFADPEGSSETENNTENNVDVEALQASVANLTKELNNAKTQNANLLAKQSGTTAHSSASVVNSSAAPAASGASEDYTSLQAQNKSLADAVSSLTAIQEASKQRASFTSKAAKDNITLTSDDFDMILGSTDQAKAYKYIKSVKAESGKHPNKPFPNSSENKDANKQPNNELGKELFEQLHGSNDVTKEMQSFIPGHF